MLEVTARRYWSATNNFVLVAIPLFVLLGELLVRGGFTDRMYRSLSDWLDPLPGGLLHTNIGASAMFAAVSGSSVATAATIGTVAIPAFKGRNYDPRLVLGTIAAGATLGILIPPVDQHDHLRRDDQHVGRPALRGGRHSGARADAAVHGRHRRGLPAGSRRSRARREPPARAVDKLQRLVDLAPPLVVFAFVMGSIYPGWATPTESAALGIVVSLRPLRRLRQASIGACCTRASCRRSRSPR